MSALSSTFSMEAKGSDAFIDAEADNGLSASGTQYNTAPRIDPMQTIRQVAQPEQPDANKASATAEQAKAVQQREQLTSKPVNTGAALSAGASKEAGASRQQTAQKEATKLATEVAKIDKVIAGDQPKTPSASNSFAKAAVGQGVGLAAAAGATMVAGPAAGAAVAAASVVYDVAAVFSGRSGGDSSFKVTNSKGEAPGYGSSASAQPAATASVSTAFMQNMMNVPGERKVDLGDVRNAGDSLSGMKVVPVSMSPAAVALAGVYKNGAEVRKSVGDDPSADNNDRLAFKPMDMKPNPGVFAPPKPMAFA